MGPNVKPLLQNRKRGCGYKGMRRLAFATINHCDSLFTLYCYCIGY